MNNNELYHHGILGQKWGIRRFQNPDGSLTPEGRRRYVKLETYRNEKERYATARKDRASYLSEKYKSELDNSSDKSSKDLAKLRLSYEENKAEYDRFSAAENRMKELHITFSDIGKMKYDDIDKIFKGIKTDRSKEEAPKRNVKDMSDAELQSIVNRIRLEQSYTDLTTPKKTSKGKAFFDKYISPGAAAASKTAIIKVGNKITDAMLSGNSVKDDVKAVGAAAKDIKKELKT